MCRQSDIEVIIVKLVQGLVLVQGSAIARAGGDALPGFQDGETVTFTQNIDKAGPAVKSGLKREG